MSAVDTSAPVTPDVAIRARPPSPKRLSRKVLLGGALVAGAVIAFALVNGLSNGPVRRAADAEAVAAAGGPPESIQQASDQYGAGDLPRGQLEDPDALLETPEIDPGLSPTAAPAWSGRGSAPAGVAASENPGLDPTALARASAILFEEGHDQGNDSDGPLSARLTPPRSRYSLLAGDVIPAALVTALNSDQPGSVIAQVTAPVYDTVSGQHLLIPQGSRLIGAYDNGVAYGDNRLLLTWTRLILPNGWSINLQGMNATDGTGAAGLRDRTDNHLGRLSMAIALSAVISVVANEAEDEEDNASLAQSVGDAAAQQAAQTGSRIVDRELTVRPTLRVRAGSPVRVLVGSDLVLRPYRAP